MRARTRSRLIRVAGVVVIGGFALAIGPAWAATITIATVNPASPVLAGTQVFVTASGFPAGGTVSFAWNGTASPETPTADGSGAIAGEAVTVPISLSPGSYGLVACSPASTCSDPFPMVVGPVLSTSAAMPSHRGTSITITVAGLQPFTTAIFGWNGALSSAGPTVPDAPSFDIATIVPAGAPAASYFQVCEQQSGSSCKSTVRTLGRLDVAVVVPPVPTAAPTAAPTSTQAAAPPPAVVTPTATRRAHRPRPLAVVTASPTPTLTAAPAPAPTKRPVPLAPTGPPTASPVALPVQGAAPLLSATSVVHLEVTAFAILSVLGGGAMLRGIAGLAVPGGGVGSGVPRGGTAGSAKVKALTRADPGLAAGDRSRTWRWKGTASVDRFSVRLPVAVAPASPLLARVLVDASYLRAMIGAPAVLLPLGGIALGTAAAVETGGRALPPSLALLIAIALVGIVDALAGLLAATAFALGVGASGGFAAAKDVRTMLGLGVVLFAVPLIAAAARPLRRLPARTVDERRRRVADVVIASLIGAWAVQKMARGLPGLAQQPLAVSRDAGLLAVVVLAASAVRIAMEELAARRYPGRLEAVQPAHVPSPGVRQRLLASCLRTAVFVFFVVAFIGQHWQLWAGAGLFLVPQLLAIVEHRFPNSERLHRVLPRGLVKIVLMLFVGTLIGQLVLQVVGTSTEAALNAFVLLSAISLVLGLVEIVGRNGKDPEEGWLRWLAGAGVLAVGVTFVLGYLTV